jgi:tetratricopeptide (TPR) repeat protein
LLRTVDIDPDNKRAHLDLAGLLLAGGKREQAREHAQAVLKLDAQNAEAQVLHSNTYAPDELATAIDEAKKAVAMDPTRSDSYLNLALLQERNKDLAAEQNFQKAISLNPKSAGAVTALGRFYVAQKRFQDAEKQFQSAIVLAPQDASPRGTLANFYLSEGKADKAEQTLRDAQAALKDNPAGYRLLGDFYLSRGEIDKAAAEFSSLYTEHPKDFAVGKSYAQVLILQNKLDEATKVNDQVLASTSKDTDALVMRGEILNKQNKSQDAVNLLAGVVKDAPESAIAHYQLGIAYAGLANWGQAESEWRTAGRLRPNTIEPQRELAALAERNGNRALLTDASEALMRIAPGSPEGYLFHSSARFSANDAAGAEKDIKKAIEVAPSNPAAYVMLGQLRLRQNRLDEAEKLLDQAQAGAPADGAALAGLVTIDLQRKDLAKALRRVQDQIARVPNNSGFYTLLGQLELRNQDSAKSEEALQKAIDLDKNNVNAFMLLANVQVSKGSVQQAIDNYNSALKANPRDVRLYVSLGGIYETQNQWQQAEDAYKKALQVQPDYPVAANNLAYLMMTHGENPNVAFSLAQTARKGLPNLPNSADTLGFAYYNTGVYSAAIDLFQQAIKADPKNPTYHYHLGMAYEKQANYPLAKKQLEEALEINPNYSQAGEIRKMLAESHN